MDIFRSSGVTDRLQVWRLGVIIYETDIFDWKRKGN